MKPRIVDVKKIRRPKEEKEDEEDVSFLIDDASQELRKKQLGDILPVQPSPGDKLEASELKRRIDEDQRKRHSFSKKLKDVLGL